MPSILASSAKGASFLILTQVCSRALTFVINQLLLRHLSPETLGISTQLELYNTTVLYFARESFRVTLQRPTSNTQVAVNVGCIPFLLGVPLSISLAILYTGSTALVAVPFITEAFALVGLASLIKLSAEPCFAVVQQRLLYGIRAKAEGASAIARCIATYLSVIYFTKRKYQVGVLPFAIGIFISSIAYVLTYYAFTIPVARQKKFSLLPKNLGVDQESRAEYIGGYFSRSLCKLSFNLYLQSGVKYVLTQGDSLLITSLATLHDQGAYALATNYGSLIARTLFQPVEESSRNIFAKLCLPAADRSDSSKDEVNGDIAASNQAEETATAKETEKDIKSLTQASQLLSRILHLYAILCLVSITIGPPLAPVLLHVVAGTRWTSTNAPQVLATYTYYIPFLAVNGVTEAFVAAVASNAELRLQSSFLLANFVGFAAATWGFVSWAEMGAEGLVWACCVALSGRCVFNGLFIRRFFGSRGVKVDFGAMFPSVGSLTAAIAVIGIVWMGKHTPGVLQDSMLDRLLGICGLAAGFAVAILGFERNFLWNCYRMLVSGAT